MSQKQQVRSESLGNSQFGSNLFANIIMQHSNDRCSLAVWNGVKNLINLPRMSNRDLIKTKQGRSEQVCVYVCITGVYATIGFQGSCSWLGNCNQSNSTCNNRLPMHQMTVSWHTEVILGNWRSTMVRAQNNGRSPDNVRPRWLYLSEQNLGLVVTLTGHVCGFQMIT